VADFESLEAIIEKMIAEMKAHEERMMTILKADLEGMKSVAEHQEVPKEEAAMQTVTELKKQYRDQHLAIKRCGQPKNGSRATLGIWKKLAAACREMTHCAGVAWRKGRSHQGLEKDSVMQGTQDGRMFGKKRPAQPVGISGIRD
jgi:hypothetical protein